MHNPESVLENETHRVLWEFEIQTANLIPASRLDLVIIKKKKKKEPAGRPLSESQKKRNERQVLGPCQQTKS